jgi:hypothetical protein
MKIIHDGSELLLQIILMIPVTSIYFFCDLIKTNELKPEDLAKVLEFLIIIILDIKSYFWTILINKKMKF